MPYRSRFMGRKTPIKQKEYHPLYLHYPHNLPEDDRICDLYKKRIVSIDPGMVNFAIRIELHDMKTKTIITEVYDKICFAKATKLQKVERYQHPDQCDNITRAIDVLDKYKEYFEYTDIILIEKQMTINTKMMSLFYQCITYFSMLLRDNPLLPMIYEICPKAKGRELGAQRGCDIKKWSIDYAINVYTERGCEFSLDVLKHYHKKRDDLADTLVQILAFNKIKPFSSCI